MLALPVMDAMMIHLLDVPFQMAIRFDDLTPTKTCFTSAAPVEGEKS